MKNLTRLAIGLTATICLFLHTFDSFSQTGNTATGTNAGNVGTDNSSFGYAAGDVVTGTGNIFVGAFAGTVTTSGTRNTIIGYDGGRYNTTGGYNAFFGNVAGNKNTTGSDNSFFGSAAGYNNTTGSRNVFIGVNAGYNETGSDKLYIDNSNTATPLIYGDFVGNKVGINALPGTYTLNVGGTVNATSLYVNGVLVNTATQWTTSGSNINFNNASGIVSIGTTVAPAGYKFAVGGKMVAEEVVIKLQANWPDYVFEKDYKLPPLAELKKFIGEHKHLPEVPTAEEVARDGMSVGEMNLILLKKIEELTLYVIDLENKVETLSNRK